MGYGERLKEIRRYYRLTQTEFAQKLYLSRNYIAVLELERKPLNNRIASMICDKFRVRLEWLLNGTGDMIQNNDPILTPEEQDEDLQKIIYKYSMLLPADKKLLADFIDRFI